MNLDYVERRKDESTFRPNHSSRAPPNSFESSAMKRKKREEKFNDDKLLVEAKGFRFK